MTDDLDTLQARPTDPVLDAPDLRAAPPVPRPVSVPSHRADVAPAVVVPNEVDEPRPASVARHSADTSAITLPVLPVAVDPSLPQPPERLTLDDGDLVRLVERRLTDTAMIDLLAVVQAQLDARQVEAERFAAWEQRISRVDGDAAAEVLERTRLRFTGVIPVQRPADAAQESPVAPAAAALVPGAPASPESSAPAPSSDGPAASTDDDDLEESADARPSEVHEADVQEVGVHAADAVVPAKSPVPSDASTASTASTTDASTASTTDVATAARPRAPRAALLTRPLVLGALGVAALVVLVAVVLVLVAPTGLASALLATLAVPAVAGLAAVGALVSVAAAPADVVRVRARGPLAVVLGVVLATALGLGVLLPDTGALAWQGWLLRAFGAGQLATGLAFLAAVLVAAAVAFVATVLLVGFRTAAPTHGAHRS